MTSAVLIIGGATASGKSALAVAVADVQGGVIINADSMQLYRGLPLLAAQPAAEDLAAAPHRLYAHLDPHDSCSAARWRDLAIGEIDAALAEGKLPIVTGGTGFYIQALTEGLSPIPDIAPGIRDAAIEKEKEMGLAAFYALLKERDPETAQRIDPFNTQRIIRAWEVLEGTGQSLAAWQDMPRDAPHAHLSFKTVTLMPPREKLYAQCDGRFLKMLDAGALEEAADFRREEKGLSPLDKALGYAEICDFLDEKISKDEMIESAQQKTRNYAKRQTTWFGNQLRADLVLEKADAAAVAAIL